MLELIAGFIVGNSELDLTLVFVIFQTVNCCGLIEIGRAG